MKKRKLINNLINHSFGIILKYIPEDIKETKEVELDLKILEETKAHLLKLDSENQRLKKRNKELQEDMDLIAYDYQDLGRIWYHDANRADYYEQRLNQAAEILSNNKILIPNKNCGISGTPKEWLKYLKK